MTLLIQSSHLLLQKKVRVSSTCRAFLHLGARGARGVWVQPGRKAGRSGHQLSLLVFPHLVIHTLQLPNPGGLQTGHSLWGSVSTTEGTLTPFLCLQKFNWFLFISCPQGTPFSVRQCLGFWTWLGRGGVGWTGFLTLQQPPWSHVTACVAEPRQSSQSQKP